MKNIVFAVILLLVVSCFDQTPKTKTDGITVIKKGASVKINGVTIENKSSYTLYIFPGKK